MKGTAMTYGRLAQILHWLSAILILVLWPVGYYMANVANEVGKVSLYQLHVGIGLFILILTIVRVVWHFIDTVPEPPDGLSPGNARAFRWTHNLLYLITLLLASSGISMLLFSDAGFLPGTVLPEAIADVPPRIAHNILSRIFLILFVAHVGGVIRHQMTKGNTLARMGIPVKER